jgi:hypothetical protein
MAGSLPRPQSAGALLKFSRAGGGGGMATRATGPEFMASLLDARVTPECAAGIARRVRMAVFIMLQPFGTFLFCLISVRMIAGTVTVLALSLSLSLSLSL